MIHYTVDIEHLFRGLRYGCIFSFIIWCAVWVLVVLL